MKSGVFQDAVESATKVFGRKESVRVVFEGSEAHTDGDTVYLPSLPSSADINVEQADIIRGFRDHESMHVRCTDTSKEGMKRLADLGAAGDAHHFSILQYCEDTRIEHAGVQEYPGMKHTLTAVNKHGAKLLLEQIESRGPAAQVVTALDKALQFRIVLSAESRNIIGVTSGGAFDALCQHIKAANPELHKLATTCAQEMAALPTGYDGMKLNEKKAQALTEESFKLAESIVKRYYALIEQQQQQPQTPPPPPPPGGDDEEEHQPPINPGPGKKGGDGSQPTQPGGGGEGGEDEGEEPEDQPENGGGKGGNEGGDTGEEGEEPTDGDDGKDGKNGGGGGYDRENDGTRDIHEGDATELEDTSEGGYGGKGHGNGTPTHGPIDVSGIDDTGIYERALKDVVQDISDLPEAKATGRGGRKTGMFHVFANRFSLKRSMARVLFGDEAARQIRRFAPAGRKKMDTAISSKRAMIRRILELELMARSDRRWESGFKHGRLQSVRLVQAIQGRETVYQRRQNGKDMDTLLYISIDGSSSMSGQLAEEASILAFALCEALERTGCEIEVSMWGDRAYTSDEHPDSTYSAKEYQESYMAFRNEINRRKAQQLPAKYVSHGVLTRAVMKSKKQRSSDPEVLACFQIAEQSLGTGTPSHTAIFADLDDLAKETHAKKIYLHITDGESNSPIEGQDRQKLMAEAHIYAKSIGVHMIGIGVNGMRVAHMFPDSVEVKGVDAYEPVIKKLAKLIAKEAGHATFRNAA